MTEEYKPTNRQRISGLEGRLEAQQTSIRRLFEEVNRLKATALDHGQRFYRYGELEAQLITRMDALENPPDVEVSEEVPEDAPERDFPCCDQGHADPPPPYILPLGKWQFIYVKGLVEADVRQRQSNRNAYTLAEDLLDQLLKY